MYFCRLCFRLKENINSFHTSNHYKKPLERFLKFLNCMIHKLSRNDSWRKYIWVLIRNSMSCLKNIIGTCKVQTKNLIGVEDPIFKILWKRMVALMMSIRSLVHNLLTSTYWRSFPSNFPEIKMGSLLSRNVSHVLDAVIGAEDAYASHAPNSLIKSNRINTKKMRMEKG